MLKKEFLLLSVENNCDCLFFVETVITIIFKDYLMNRKFNRI